MKEIKCPKCKAVFQVDEASYADIVKQVRDSEFTKEVSERVKNEVELVKSKAEKEFDKELFEKQEKINELESKLNNAKSEKENAVALTKAEKDNEISELKSQLDKAETEKKLAVKGVEDKLKEQLKEKETELMQLQNKKELIIKEQELNEINIRRDYDSQLRAKDEIIAFYKDFKAKLSTKGIGESLEKFCEQEFENLRSTAFRNAYFKKDNEVKEGSKGDYVFREHDIDGTPIVSIMFEMKNEADETATKHKNEDFLDKLNKDRKNKGCDYAVLVSMLESDNDFYNRGIVDMSHKYPKMFVIRPQFFIPMIALIRNMAMDSIDNIRELVMLRNQNSDMVAFNKNLEIFKGSFNTTAKNYHKKFGEAIKGIDNAIESLKKIRDALSTSDKHLTAAENKVEDLNIKKLTKDSPLLQAQFNSMLITDKGKSKKK